MIKAKGFTPLCWEFHVLWRIIIFEIKNGPKGKTHSEQNRVISDTSTPGSSKPFQKNTTAVVFVFFLTGLDPFSWIHPSFTLRFFWRQWPVPSFRDFGASCKKKIVFLTVILPRKVAGNTRWSCIPTMIQGGRVFLSSRLVNSCYDNSCHVKKPLEINMSPKRGPCQKEISSSNHHISGDMIIFWRMLSLSWLFPPKKSGK